MKPAFVPSVLTLCCTLFFAGARAQVFRDLDKRIERKVNQRIERKVDQVIDKGLDEAENAPKKKRKNREAKSDTASKREKTGAYIAPERSGGNGAAGSVYYAHSGLVPGEPARENAPRAAGCLRRLPGAEA